MKCEECRELYVEPRFNGCICGYSKEPKMPIYEGQRSDEYMWCEGRGFRSWEKENDKQ